jgi:hypothetical protein
MITRNAVELAMMFLLDKVARFVRRAVLDII